MRKASSFLAPFVCAGPEPGKDYRDHGRSSHPGAPGRCGPSRRGGGRAPGRSAGARSAAAAAELPRRGRARHRGRGRDRQAGPADPRPDGGGLHGAGRRSAPGDQQLRGGRGATGADSRPGPGAQAERPRVSTNAKDQSGTGRTFVIFYDNRNLTLDEGIRAKAAVAQFLEKGAREGDRVMLVASEGDAWWSTQVEEGRPELVSMLKRLEGRLVPDLSPERITPWEAMRIYVYRDEAVAFRVMQRLEKYNAIPADGSGRTGQHLVFDNPYLTQRATQVYQDTPGAQPGDTGAAEPDHALARREPGPQGRAARLGRLHLRHDAAGHEARPGLRASLQRRHLLPRRPRPRGHAGRAHGAVRHGAHGRRSRERRLRRRVHGQHDAHGRAGLRGGAGRSPPRAAASRSRTPTTSPPASPASPTSRRPTTCSGTGRRTRCATAASARSRWTSVAAARTSAPARATTPGSRTRS